jgi:glycosyltransferase involved in cell wall biosynthesis
MESFGMVQAEAMLCGTPVVASDLPGVRQPVRRTGMGLLSASGDPASVARCLSEVLENREGFVRPRDAILEAFGLERCLADYEALFQGLMSRFRIPAQARNGGGT